MNVSRPITGGSGSGSSNYGDATALSLMLAVTLAILSIVYFRVTRSWSES